MKLLSGTIIQRIFTLICVAVLIAGLVGIVISLSAFHLNKNQLDAIIAKDIALETQQDEKDVSFTILAVKEQHNVRVLLLQYEGTDGVETKVAIFTKLPLLSLYRYDKMVSLDKTTEVASVIDTGLTDELVVANGKDIDISTAGLGIVSECLIMFVLFLLVSFLSIKIRAMSKKEGISPFFK